MNFGSSSSAKPKYSRTQSEAMVELSEIRAENEGLRRENEILHQKVGDAKAHLQEKVRRIHTENDRLTRENMKMQMLLAEVRRIRDVRSRLDQESSQIADQYDTLIEENETLREKLAQSEFDETPMIRVEPGKVMSTPRKGT